MRRRERGRLRGRVGDRRGGAHGDGCICAVEYVRDGIRVNAIAPGFHGGTKLGHEGRSGPSPEWIASVEAAIHAKIPMGRRGTPAELEGLAIFLASDASSSVTGQIFANDGGWTAA